MISPEVSAKLQEYKAKQQAGTITIEELRDAVTLMRGSRVAAASISSSSTTTKRKAIAKENIDGNALLDQLGGL